VAYLELIIIIILEDERRGAGLVNKVKLILIGDRQHLRDELGGLISPGD
jgi:hypothetical protein